MNDDATDETPGTTAPEPARPIGELLRLAADRALPVLRGIPDDRLTAPTPCSEYDVHTLVNHLFHVLVQFQQLAAKQGGEFGTPPDYVAEGADWRERFATAADDLVAAWSEPGAEEGSTGAMHMPARTVGSMALLDLTVHAWDLARGTGQDFHPDEKVLRALRATVAELAPTGRKMGAFGEPFPLPDDSGDAAAATGDGSTFDRMLADIGRNPGWTAPGAA